MPCADSAMVTQDTPKMEFREYFDPDDMIEWEEKDEANQKFTLVQKLFKNKYDSCIKHSKKKHGKFEGANVIQHVTQRQEQLDADLQDYIEKLASKNSEDINDMRTSNKSTVTLNETLLQTIAAQNKKISKLFQMVAAHATASLKTNNQTIVPPTTCQGR